MPLDDSATATPLVGRSGELNQLRGAVGLGSDPRPAAIVLGGDAGVGKTRVLTELRRAAATDGWRVLIGHCLDFSDGALPYLPFTEIAGRLEADEPELMATIVAEHPAITRLLPGRRTLVTDAPAPRSGDDEGSDMARADLFQAVHAVFERLGREGPLLVVVEDVHWADRSTRDLISFLFARGFTTPVSVVVSYRSDDLHRRHPLRSTVAEWGRLAGVTRLQLDLLDDADVRVLIRAAHSKGLTEPDLEEIVRRAEGNAFFAEELLVAQEAQPHGLPSSLADLLLVRLDRLDDDARVVVRAAAAAGRHLPHELLTEVVDLPEATLDAAVRAAVDANILVPTSAASYSFRHALLAEAVHDDLLPGERRRLHAAFSQALSQGRTPGTAAELARHARLAHDLDTALDASVQAGDDARKVAAPDEAAEHYLAALELLADPRIGADSDVNEVTVLLKAADSLMTAGHVGRALDLVHDRVGPLTTEASADDDAQTTTATAGEGDLTTAERAELLTGLALLALLVDDAQVSALRATSEALQLIDPEPSKLRARALSVHARANVDRGRFDEAARFAQEALELAEQVGADHVRVDAATLLGRLKDYTGDPDASLEALNQVLADARASGDVIGLIRVLHQIAGITLEAGDPARAREHYAESYSLAVAHGRAWAPYGFDARVLGGVAAYMTGDWDAAVGAADVSTESAPPLLAAMLATMSLAVAAGRGAVTEAMIEELRPWWIQDGLAAVLGIGPAIEFYGDTGDAAAAVAIHDEGVAAVQSRWNVPGFQAEVRLAAQLIGQLANAVAGGTGPEREALVQRGEELAQRATEVADNVVGRGRRFGPEGTAWLLRGQAELGRLRWLAGVGSPDPDDLAIAWQQAMETFEQIGHVFEVARCQARLAVVLQAQGSTDQARQLRDRAREVAERLGAEPLLRELGAAPAPAATGRRRDPGDVTLTPREKEVLSLVAEGRTNGQIAQRLFISTKTVSVHVSNILAKLGASGRTEAAALARRRGLVS